MNTVYQALCVLRLTTHLVIDLRLHSTLRRAESIDMIQLLLMNRWLAQLGLVAPGGPLNDHNFHKAVTVYGFWSQSHQNRSFWSPIVFQILHESRWP